MSRLAIAVWNAYSSNLKQRPYTTQIVSSGLIWAVGDVLAQQLDSRPYQLRRTLMTSLYGAAFIAPVGHAWYLGLDRAARRYFRPGGAAFIASKVVLDTAVFGPLHVGAYFGLMQLGEGGGLPAVRRKLESDFWPTFSAECAYWPVLQAINFKLVPAQYQLLVVNFAAILDSAFMSFAGAHDDWLAEYLPTLAAAVRGPPAKQQTK